jgi:16S rRNA processing protein RimM
MSKQFKKKEPLLHIATLGKTVGIKGDMKLHILSDFPEQFVAGAVFLAGKNKKITLREVNLERGLVKIDSIVTPEDAKKFTNTKLYTTYEQTRKDCDLNEGEYFFFDLEDCEVYEDGKHLGSVYDVQRIGVTNYLNITTEKSLVEKGLSKSFMVPFIEPFKVDVDIEKKVITLNGALDILEAS